MARKTSLMIEVSGYGLILFISIAFVFSRYVRVEISSFLFLLLLFSWVFHIYGFGFIIS